MSPIIKSTISSLFVIALSAAGAAGYAAEKERSGKSSEWPSFRKVDTDNNGAISMDEAKSVPGLSEEFSQYDKNNDGQLSRSEYEAAKKAAKKSARSSSSKSGSSTSGGAGSSKSSGSSSDSSSNR